MTLKNSQPKQHKLKLVTVVGTRPEVIKLSETIKKCDEFFEHTIVHTGQNYDYTLNQIFFDELKIREPDHYLDAAGEHLGATLGNVIAKSYSLLSKIKPDAVLLLGDTNSALAAISAKRLKIPIFHMEAGNRCFDQNVPEEINRKIIDHISDVNLPYTEHARRYLLNEGLKPEYTIVTGSPMLEVLQTNQDIIKYNDVLDRLDLKENEYFVLSTHREENVDSEQAFNKLINSANAIANYYNKTIVFSVHPRTRQWLKSRAPKLHNLIKICEPFGFSDYIKLQQYAYCVISDSGTLSEESAILEFPAISVRTSTERPEGIDAGGMILAGLDSENIINSINLAVAAFEDTGLYRKPDAYIEDNVSYKVVKIIQGYTGLINEFIWRKNNKNKSKETTSKHQRYQTTEPS